MTHDACGQFSNPRIARAGRKAACVSARAASRTAIVNVSAVWSQPGWTRRLAARVDPSDIVQETLADAGRRLPEYLRHRRVPYWIWLRTLALQRLIWWRRFHIVSGKRSVNRERWTRFSLSLSGNAGAPLVESMICSDTSPSARVVGDEAKIQARLALDSLDPIDRQILDLRYLKERSFAEIASDLGLGLIAVKMRHRRALDRFARCLRKPGSTPRAERN